LLNAIVQHLLPSDDPYGGKRRGGAASRPVPAELEDLPYKVELWDDRKQAIEQVLAITSSGSIGYAAYFAATKEYAQRYITLRHKNAIINRWNPPTH
jgi:hypothetical protein